MAISVQTNTAALTALKNLNTNNANMNNSLNRLSSGFRINSAADDASGFAVSSKLDAQAGRLKAASQNATQATAMVKMADAGVNEIQNMVNRIQTLATQAASSNNTGELGKLDAERVKLESQINKIANSTNYNGVNLLNGKDATSTVAAGTGVYTAGTNTGLTAVSVQSNAKGVNDTYTVTLAADGLTATVKDSSGINQGSKLLTVGTADTAAANQITLANGAVLGFTVGAAADTTSTDGGSLAVTGAGNAAYTGAQAFQVGADNNGNNQIAIDLTSSYTTTGLNLGSGTGAAAGGNLLSQSSAQTYIDTAKSAMNTLIIQRADLGATANQLGFVQANLATSIEQTTASVSSIKDADMAAEMANFTKNKILTQAGTSMLAQANQAAQNVMTLFR